MKFDVLADMTYTANSAGTLILNIHALRTPTQTVIAENFTIQPYIKAEELVNVNGENRLIRLQVEEPCNIAINYHATIDNAWKLVNMEGITETPVYQLPAEVLQYLNPSRYCQSDKLFRLANNMFGNTENPFLTVLAMVEWIHTNVQYLSGSTNAQTSAFDTVTEQSGVCRDFAHLGIALCRALTIPARYFTGYAYKLQPADFHACFEAYIAGEWILFDATKLVPLNGLVKIATGSDAADAAIANIFGDISFDTMLVNCTLNDEGFVPHYYYDNCLQGLSYL
ncbi:transglutaminase family protein [Mucilaginibacter sp. UR6-1]|uniref:transglutaminase-like domain-containing protein n=1 Tax=Mucilaginibacter sp. UR6-1 TaxID=1435643 RepID=UPI001E5361FE|nr:transglutaminase family protein [Mucilaginibacter sp. UR6-1]MCC8408973.1 transglutaminase family protein [Mucilaginibacter sp. UR6-1]